MSAGITDHSQRHQLYCCQRTIGQCASIGQRSETTCFISRLRQRTLLVLARTACTSPPPHDGVPTKGMSSTQHHGGCQSHTHHPGLGRRGASAVAVGFAQTTRNKHLECTFSKQQRAGTVFGRLVRLSQRVSKVTSLNCSGIPLIQTRGFSSFATRHSNRRTTVQAL
jgi:hypothetical protein